MKRGKLIILSGPSGVGKGTVRIGLVQKAELNLYYSVSMTTRPMRPGEVDGKDYFFVSKEEFKKVIERDGFLEWNNFVNNYYGTPADAVAKMRDEGKNVLLEIDVNGAKKVMAKCPDAVTIFLVPPSLEQLEARIRGRRTEEESIIQERLGKAKAELEESANYQHIVCNDKVEQAVEDIANIILNA